MKVWYDVRGLNPRIGSGAVKIDWNEEVFGSAVLRDAIKSGFFGAAQFITEHGGIITTAATVIIGVAMYTTGYIPFVERLAQMAALN